MVPVAGKPLATAAPAAPLLHVRWPSGIVSSWSRMDGTSRANLARRLVSEKRGATPGRPRHLTTTTDRTNCWVPSRARTLYMADGTRPPPSSRRSHVTEPSPIAHGPLASVRTWRPVMSKTSISTFPALAMLIANDTWLRAGFGHG